MADKGGPGDGKLQNPFSKDRDGFLSFSSSTPQQSQNAGSGSGGSRGRFIPRRGKANRLNNWTRFGESNADDRPNPRPPSSESSPYRGGHGYQQTPPDAYFSPRGRGWGFQGGFQNRGSPGFRGPFHGGQQPRHHQQQQQQQQQSPRWNRGRGGGGGPGFTPRGRGQNFHGGNRSYFHPSMLENPWSELLASRPLSAHNRSSAGDVIDDSEAGLSDSLVVQVGTSMLDSSLINPAPDVSDDDDDGGGSTPQDEDDDDDADGYY